jgi:hypothetical protein
MKCWRREASTNKRVEGAEVDAIMPSTNLDATHHLKNEIRRTAYPQMRLWAEKESGGSTHEAVFFQVR